MLAARTCDAPAVPRSPHPAPPRITSPSVSSLDPADPEWPESGHELDGVHVTGADLTGRRLRDVRWRESVIADATVDDVDLRGARLTDVRLEAVTATTFSAPLSTWRDAEVVASRWGAAELYEVQWTSVVLRGCKVAYLNLRGSTLVDVLVEDCVIDALDLQSANVERLAVVGGRVGELLLAESTLRDVDLRVATIDDVSPARALVGASLTTVQVLDVAPRLAAELGIDVH